MIYRIILLFVFITYPVNIIVSQTLDLEKVLQINNSGYYNFYWGESDNMMNFNPYTKLHFPNKIDDMYVYGILDFPKVNHSMELELPDSLRILKGLNNLCCDTCIIQIVKIPNNLSFIEGARIFLTSGSRAKLPKAYRKDHILVSWNDTLQPGDLIPFNVDVTAKFKYTKDDFYLLSLPDFLFIRNGIRECFYRGASKLEISDQYQGDTVYYINDNSFSNIGLKSIKLPTSLKIIGKYSVSNNQIDSIIIPNNVYDIKEGAFSHNSIRYIEFSSKIKTLSKRVLEYNNIKEIKIPQNIKRIEEYSFYNNRINKIHLHSEITYIGIKAFADNDLVLENTPVLPTPNIKGKTFLYWQSFKKGKYIRETKSFEEIPVAKCQPGDKMDLELGYKAVFKEDL